MGKLFDLDSPLMVGLGKLADMIWLNILMIFCCLPVFTIGASMTALHYVVLKMVKNEESYITKSFFKSFKQNFRQATVMTIILIAVFFIFVIDFVVFYTGSSGLPGWFNVVMIGIAIIVMLSLMHLFPLLARYENTIAKTFRNSLFMGILHLPKTVLMLLCWVIPVVIFIFVPFFTPLVLLLGISGPAYLNALLYKKSFQKLEPEEKIASDMEFSIQTENEEITEESEIEEIEETKTEQ